MWSTCTCHTLQPPLQCLSPAQATTPNFWLMPSCDTHPHGPHAALPTAGCIVISEWWHVGPTASSHHGNSTPFTFCRREPGHHLVVQANAQGALVGVLLLKCYSSPLLLLCHTGYVDTSISWIMLIFSELALAVIAACNCDKQSVHWFWLSGLYSILYKYALKMTAHLCIRAAASVSTSWFWPSIL